MATEKIERLISKEAIAAFQELKDLVDANVSGFEKLVESGVQLNQSLGKAKSFKEFNEEITKLKNNETLLISKVDELTDALDKLQKKKSESATGSTALEKAQQKLSDSYSAEARELAQVREQQNLVNKANKQSAQETLGLVDAYKKLENEFAKASRNAQNLSVEYGVNSKEAKEAIELANQLGIQLKEADYSIGKYGRNVGNYGNALKTLETYLSDVRKELSATKQAAAGGLIIPTQKPTGAGGSGVGARPASMSAKSGVLKKPIDDTEKALGKYNKTLNDSIDRIESLTKQEELLARIVQSQAAGYASATAQLKANEKALQTLAAAGMQSTEFYQVLLKETAELKDGIGDLKDEIKALASDTRQFDLVAGAITGLVDIMQVGVGVAAVFSSNEEQLQKSIERLIAVQNIAQGVQSLANELTTKGTALNKIYNFIMQEGTASKNADTAATATHTVTTEADAAATEAATIATGGLATAMKVLRGALVASGIGLLIAGVIYLISKLDEWRNADLNLIKRQTELNNVILETIRLERELAGLIKTDIGTEAQRAKNAISYAQAYGKSQGEILKNEEKLLTVRRDASTIKFFDTGGSGSLDKLKQSLEIATAAYEEFINEQAKIGEGAPGKLTKERYDAEKALLQSQLDLAREKFSAQREIVDEYTNDNIELDSKTLQIERFNDDERRKRALESANIRANIEVDANGRILDNERTMMAERLKLIDENVAAEQDRARAKNKDVQKDASATPADKDNSQNNLNYELEKLTLDGEETKRKIREEYRRRNLEADLRNLEATADLTINKNQEIADNEKNILEERLFARYTNLKTQETVISAEKSLQLDAAGLTAKEREAIENEANTKILLARMQFTRDVNSITISDLEKQGETRLGIAAQESSKELIQLNEKLTAGLVSYEKYNKERLKIEAVYGDQVIAIQIENIQILINEYRIQGKDVAQLETELAEKQKQISDDLTQYKLRGLEAYREKQMQIGQELTDFFVAIDEASIEREQEKIDQQIEEVESRKERETDFVNQTIRDEQERADAIAVINETAARDKEMLAQRQKRLDQDKARTDKIIAIAQITTDTIQTAFKLSAEVALAKARAAALASNPVTAAYAPVAAAAAATIAAQIPLVIGLGAANAAKIAITKAFRFGGTTTEDGTVIVGDGFQHEYGVTDTGGLIETPAVPTLMNLPKNTRIYPNKASLENAILNDTINPAVYNDNGALFKMMGDRITGSINGLGRIIKKKKETHIHMGRKGWDEMRSGNRSDYYTSNLG